MLFPRRVEFSRSVNKKATVPRVNSNRVRRAFWGVNVCTAVARDSLAAVTRDLRRRRLSLFGGDGLPEVLEGVSEQCGWGGGGVDAVVEGEAVDEGYGDGCELFCGYREGARRFLPRVWSSSADR
jgi:hypothetical protein